MPSQDHDGPLDLSLDELTADLFGNQYGSRIAQSLDLVARNLGNERIVDWAEITARLSLSRRTIQRLMDAGDFPARIELSDCRSGWRNSEIERWIRSRPRFSGE